MEQKNIAGKDEYTINASLVINCLPVIGLLDAPKRKGYFILMGRVILI